MIDVILADNTRPACGGPRLIRYNAAGVYLELLNKGLEARWLDLMADKERPAQQSTGPCGDVQCYAVYFGNKVNAFKMMEEARSSPKAPRLIIAFGPFAAVFAEEILNRRLADMVVSHDAEFVVPALLACDLKALGGIPNLSYRHEGKIIHTVKSSHHGLDDIPFISPFLAHKGHRPAFIMAGRGCQYHCVFCDRNVLWGGGVRYRRMDNVLAEIKELAAIGDLRELRFLDEDLPADKARMVEICEGIRRIGPSFFWSCSSCVDSVDQKLLVLMAKSGCKEIYFGVESASPQVLRKIGKKYGREQILDAVRFAREAGLQVEVMLTTGNPGETDEDRALTLSALEEMGGRGITLRTNRLVILPGTAFYRQGLKEGRFTEKSFFEDEGLIFYDEKERV